MKGQSTKAAGKAAPEARLGKADQYLCRMCRQSLPMVEITLGVDLCLKCRTPETTTENPIQRGSWVYREGAEPTEYEVYTNGRMICWLSGAHGDGEANARLIAAAPRMRDELAALEVELPHAKDCYHRAHAAAECSCYRARIGAILRDVQGGE